MSEHEDVEYASKSTIRLARAVVAANRREGVQSDPDVVKVAELPLPEDQRIERGA